ncbi:MAG: glucose-1-phosphate adenylyltransferase [Planctomycetota bacterium]
MTTSVLSDDLRDTLVIILAGGKGDRLYPLTRDRTKPAVPFGGSYRIVDFTLSNCLNSGLRHIYLLTQYKSLSLSRHLRRGWQIFNESAGEFIVTVPPQMRLGGSWYQGTADAIFQNIYSLERERPRWVAVLSGDHIYKMDYGKMIDFHRRNEADLTVACIEVGREEAPHFGIAGVDATQRIVNFQEKPADPQPIPGSDDRFLASMGVYIFETNALVRRLSQDAKRRESSHDFGKDVIPAMIGKDRVFAYPFVDENRSGPAYWRDIGRLDAYFEANMDLVSADPHFVLEDPRWPIRTAAKFTLPTRTVTHAGTGQPGTALDSLLASGSNIVGGHVERSILGYHVTVREGARISDSIIMDDVEIGAGAEIRRAIIDKRVVIPPGTEIGVDPVADAERYDVTESGIVVIPKEMAF